MARTTDPARIKYAAEVICQLRADKHAAADGDGGRVTLQSAYNARRKRKRSMFGGFVAFESFLERHRLRVVELADEMDAESHQIKTRWETGTRTHATLDGTEAADVLYSHTGRAVVGLDAFNGAVLDDEDPVDARSSAPPTRTRKAQMHAEKHAEVGGVKGEAALFRAELLAQRDRTTEKLGKARVALVNAQANHASEEKVEKARALAAFYEAELLSVNAFIASNVCRGL